MVEGGALSLLVDITSLQWKCHGGGVNEESGHY